MKPLHIYTVQPWWSHMFQHGDRHTHTRLAGCKKPHLTSHRFTVTYLIHGFLCVICRVHRLSSGPHSVSVSESPSDFSSPHQRNGLWKQGKWFSSDNRGCISPHYPSPFTIHPANGNNGIHHRRRHPQNNGNTGGTMNDSNRSLGGATGSQVSPKRNFKSCH